MSKAYDRMEWGFLQHTMIKMGFAEPFVEGPVSPERGLRQKDPISPYLFIICAEGLSTLISDNERRGRLHGCKVARGLPSVSHLFFANDSFFYFKAVKKEDVVIK